jgi:hypothetical protein
MNSIEAVKEILEDVRRSASKLYPHVFLEEYARQIDALYQKPETTARQDMAHFQATQYQPDDDLLLSDEERSEVIQRDTTLWCPTKGEFLDEVGLVIAKAQLAHCKPMIEARSFKKGVKATMDWAVKRHYVTDYDLDKFIDTLKGEPK